MKGKKFNSFSYTIGIVISILLIGLIFASISYYTLISLLEVHQGIFDFLKALIYNENEGFGLVSKLVLSAKILNVGVSFLLVLLSFAMFSSGLSAFFYTRLAEKYGYEEVNLVKVFKKSFKWQLYRYSATFAALVGFVVISGVLMILGISFFNLIVTGMGINTAFTSFILSFIGFNMMFFLSFAVLFTLWKGINLCFGTEIAVSEPELDNDTISRRSEKVVFAQAENVFLFVVFLAFGLFLVIEAGSLDIFDKAIFSIFFAVNALSYAAIKYLKTSAYINSLLKYYEKVKISV